jgi:hypothetical protein
MLYSTLLVAATAFSSFAAAQNGTSDLTLPAGFETCCSLPLNQINSSQTATWCKANTNTCPDLCGGGQGSLAAQGNLCNEVSDVMATAN